MNLIWTSYHLIRMMFFSLIYLNNESYMDWIQVIPCVTLNNITRLNIFELDANLTNLPLDYIIFVYSLYLQIFKMIKD